MLLFIPESTACLMTVTFKAEQQQTASQFTLHCLLHRPTVTTDKRTCKQTVMVSLAVCLVETQAEPSRQPKKEAADRSKHRRHTTGCGLLGLQIPKLAACRRFARSIVTGDLTANRRSVKMPPQPTPRHSRCRTPTPSTQEPESWP